MPWGAGLGRRAIASLRGLAQRLWEWPPPSVLVAAKEPGPESRQVDPKVWQTLRPPLPFTPTAAALMVSTSLSEQRSETEFLRHCLRYGNAPEQQALRERIAQRQRDVRCVQRAVWLMALLTGLAATGLGYVAMLERSISPDQAQWIVNGAAALGLAAVISLVAFVGLLVVFRMNLNEHRAEGRRLVATLLADRLGEPATALAGERHVGGETALKAAGDWVADCETRANPDAGVKA